MSARDSAAGTDAQLGFEMEQCLRLRLMGKSIRQIGAMVGMSKSTVERRLRGAIGERIDPLADQLRAVEVARLDQLLETVWSTIRPDVDAAAKLAAVDRLVKISERRSKLLGLDAPVSVSARVSVEDDEDAKLANMIDAMKEQMLREQAAGPREIAP